MKKVQITTAAIKAEAQVIVLDVSFVSRIAKAQVELNSAVNNIKNAANYAHRMLDNKGNVCGVEDMVMQFKDINRIDRVLDIINEIYFAFNEDEDGTAPANISDNTFKGYECD